MCTKKLFLLHSKNTKLKMKTRARRSNKAAPAGRALGSFQHPHASLAVADENRTLLALRAQS
jgi:hypothetical protein